MKRLRVAIYLRFSAEMQSRRSCDDQERENRTFCKGVEWDVVLVARDEAQRSGATAGRVGWQAILGAARRKEFDVLLVEEISRFSRDFFEGLAALQELRSLGIAIADAKEGIINLDSRDGQMRIAMELSGSEHEVRRLGERSKRGLKGKVLDKFSGGGEAPYGLVRVPVFSETVLDVDDRPVRLGVRFRLHATQSLFVRRMFEQYRDGFTKGGIARELNREGIPSKHAGRTRKGRPNSGSWSAASVKKILENEIYIGCRDWNKHSRSGPKLATSGKKQLVKNLPEQWVHVDDYAPPIIDVDTWEAVQARLKADASEYKQKHNVNETKRYLLSGFVRCVCCGGSFVIGMHRKGTSIYACSFRKRGACSNKMTLPQPALEARVREALDAIVKDPARLKELVAEHNRKLHDKNDEQRAVVFGLEGERDRVAKEAARLLDAIAEGKGSSSLLMEKIQRHERLLAELDGRVADAKTLIQPLLVPSTASKLADYVSGSASIFLDEHARDRSLVERVLDKILVYASGEIVLVFRQDSLFAPVMTVTMTADAKGASRKDHRTLFGNLKKNVGRDARVWVQETETGATYAATTSRLLAAGESGSEWFELADAAPSGGEIALATPTGKGRDFGADCEIALATPTGEERDFASLYLCHVDDLAKVA